MPQAMTVGFENKRELFSESNFGNMLKTINSYERSDDVAVMSVQEATELQLRSEDGAFSEPETEAQRYLNELKEALDSVNMRIQSIGKG